MSPINVFDTGGRKNEMEGKVELVKKSVGKDGKRRVVSWFYEQ